MRIKKAMWAFGLAIGLIAAVSAQEVQVTYQDGTVQLKSGSSWKAVNIGDKLAADATVKLDKDASLEMKSGTTVLVISQPGTYALKDILAARKKTEVSGVGKTLQSSFGQLVGSAPVQKQSTVAGVRAANKSASDQPTWVTSDTDSIVESGKLLLKSGKYTEALAKFKEAMDEATDDETPQIRYLTAYSLTLTGDIRGALKQLQGLDVNDDEDWAGDFVLLKARLLEESFAWTEAITWLNTRGASLANDVNRGPLYHFLLGYAYSSTGDNAKAKVSLTKVVSLGKDTELGKAAAAMIQ